MNISVQETPDGYSVLRDDEIIASGLSNSEAWRLADRMSLEPVSRAENLSDWVARKEANNARAAQASIGRLPDVTKPAASTKVVPFKRGR